MALAALAFTLMISAVKVARAELSAVELIFWRAVLSTPIMALICARRGFGLQRRGIFLLRAGFGFAAMIGYYTAAKGLTVADLSILTKLQPVWVAIAAPVLMGSAERAGGAVWARWPWGWWAAAFCWRLSSAWAASMG